MHPVVCLDRGFSSQFEGEFGWFARGKEYRVERSDEIADGLVYLQDRASQGAWIVFALYYEAGFHLMELPQQLREKQQASNLVLGLGSGLVADSVLQDEWQECLLKGKFSGIS